jgi:hypothetical protein
MSDDDMLTDPWGIADEIDGLVDGYDPSAEEPPTVTDEQAADWAGRRLLALRFTADEMRQVQAQYAAEIARLRQRLEEEIARLNDQRDEHVEQLQSTLVALSGQLQRMHAQRIAHSEQLHRIAASAAADEGRSEPKKRLPTTIRVPHGTLRSRQASSNAVVSFDPEHETDIVKWLEANGYGEGVRVKPAVAEQRLVDKRKLGGLVKRDDDGKIVGLTNDAGDECPHVTVTDRGRAYWIELPDGRSSKDWMPEH